MTGERLAWFRVASHLSIPVEEIAERITYREFLGWMDFLKWDDDRDTKTHYYLAQIAATVQKSVLKLKDAKKVKISDYILRTDSQLKAATDSKSIWMAHLGIKPKK